MCSVPGIDLWNNLNWLKQNGPVASYSFQLMGFHIVHDPLLSYLKLALILSLLSYHACKIIAFQSRKVLKNFMSQSFMVSILLVEMLQSFWPTSSFLQIFSRFFQCQKLFTFLISFWIVKIWSPLLGSWILPEKSFSITPLSRIVSSSIRWYYTKKISIHISRNWNKKYFSVWRKIV